jgi:hypothetical protein
MPQWLHGVQTDRFTSKSITLNYSQGYSA